MRVNRRGVQRLLDALITGASHLTCAACQEQLPRLVDVVMAGSLPAETMPEVVRHVDHCPQCEELFLELLGDLQVVLSEPVAPVVAKPDLGFLPLSPTLDDIWRTTLETVSKVIRSRTGRLATIQISLRLPRALAPRPARGTLAGPLRDEKLLLSDTLVVDGGIQVELRAYRDEPDAPECRLLAEVDSRQPDAELPHQLVLHSDGDTWVAPFNEWGQATIVGLPIAALASLEIDLSFGE